MKKGATKKPNEVFDSPVFSDRLRGLIQFVESHGGADLWDSVVDRTALSFAELTPAFLNKLRDLIKSKVKDGDLSADDWNEAVRKARAHAGGKGKAAKSKSEEADVEMSEDSLTDKISKVEAAIRKQYQTKDSSGYSQSKYWPREVFDSYVIVNEYESGKLYKVPYALNVQGEIEFGEFQEVEEDYVAVTMNVLDVCKEGGSFRLFNEYDFADPPDWIPLLPKPGTYKHPDYGLIELDEKRLDRFIANINGAIYQSKLPINAEHKPSDEGALGWVTEARKNTDGSVDGKASWTDLGKEAIENDRFQYISPEWLDKWKQASTGKTIDDVLIGAALTVRPFFKEDSMRPLIASERGWLTISGADHKKLLQSNGNCVIFAQTLSEVKQMADTKKCAMPGCEEDAMTGKKYCEAHMKEKGMAEQNTEVKQAAEKITALEGTVKTLSDTVTAQADQLKLATETIGNQNVIINRMVTDARKKEFSEIVKDFPGNKDSHIDVLEMYFEKHKCSEPGKCACGSADCKGGKEAKQFTDYVTQQKSFAEQIKTAREFGGNLFGEIGSTAADGAVLSAQDKVKTAAEARAKEKNISTDQATTELFAEQPALYEAYRQETTIKV